MWRVGAKGEWHLWFPALQGETPSDFLMHLRAEVIVTIAMPKKPSRFQPHGKCETNEVPGNVVQRKMSFNSKTVASCFVKCIVHGVAEIYCNMTPRRGLPCCWQNLRMVEKEMMNVRLDYLISFPTMPVNPYSKLYYPGNLLFYRAFHYETKLVSFCLQCLWFLDNVIINIHSHIASRKFLIFISSSDMCFQQSFYTIWQVLYHLTCSHLDFCVLLLTLDVLASLYSHQADDWISRHAETHHEGLLVVWCCMPFRWS